MLRYSFKELLRVTLDTFLKNTNIFSESDLSEEVLLNKNCKSNTDISSHGWNVRFDALAKRLDNIWKVR